MRNCLAKSLRHAAWAPLCVFVFYIIATKGFNAYLIYPWLDMPTHFFGGIAITYFYLIATRYSQVMIGNIPGLIQCLMCLGLTATTAIFWEFLEFGSDLLLGTKMNLGVSDTLSDLFFGLVGAGALIATISFFEDVKSKT